MKKIQILLALLSSLLFYYACESEAKLKTVSKVKTGAEVLIEEHLQELEGKKVGLVMNPTARIGNTHVLDTLLALDVTISALYAPEHGFRGDAGAGEIIEDGVDQATGIPVYSLYGATKKPTREMLEGIDLLLFDMQDVGARFYTYNSTMKYVIEAAAEIGIEVWILDRPNPAGGEYVAGWVLEEGYESFVGMYPIPVAHGLTLGELALMAEGEGWFDTEQKPNVQVISMSGWARDMKWPDTGLDWFPPSPNLPQFENAYVYLGTCFFEGTTLSEGRGTDSPFMTLGAPETNLNWTEVEQLSEKYGIRIDSINFVPQSIPGKALNPKHQNEKSNGVLISEVGELTDPVRFGIELMKLMMDETPGAEYKDFLYLLSGTKRIDLFEAEDSWGSAFNDFTEARKKYLLYD